jgi:1,4-dihydroxy-6-naphthoate synthase
MKLTLGFSPCPNDTFIFDALVNKNIDSEGLEFEPVLADVETLNQWALEGKLDVTKLSFPAFFQSLEHYTLLDAGSALGKGVGPLLIAKQPNIDIANIPGQSIAIPGTHTTANLLLGFAFPAAANKIPLIFSAIEDAVLSGQADAGVIIHENRFTYAQKGLYKVMDLGEHWEEKMKVPVPLGGIAVSQSLKRSIAVKINNLIRKSLQSALANDPEIPTYVKQNAQEMDEHVMRQHIDLYVNDYSLNLGNEGKKAIGALFDVYKKVNNVKEADEPVQLFI